MMARRSLDIDAFLLRGAVDERRRDDIGQRIARGLFGFKCRARLGNGVAPRFQTGAHGFGLFLRGCPLLFHSGALLFGRSLGRARTQRRR